MSVEALHTAARRYLIDRLAAFGRAAHERGAARLAGRPPGDLPEPPGDATIARDLLRAVEARMPEDFGTVDALRRWLLDLGGRFADDRRYPESTTGRGEHIRVRFAERDAEELAAARAEREAFRAFVGALGEDELRAVAPLPYRRLLQEGESARWRAALTERWGARPREDGWYPLAAGPPRPDVLALQDEYFYFEVAPEAFRALFRRRGIDRVFEFVENHVFFRDYELDVALFTPRPWERFWTSPALDWVVYVSHERSITVAGDWLVAGVRAIWPNWRERVYAGMDYPAPRQGHVLLANPWFRWPWHDLPWTPPGG